MAEKLALRKSLAEDFGQRVPPLCKLLRTILERYPEGGQILKELIQNADDAEAKDVQFLLDCRKNAFGTQSLLHDEMKHFQGPALYAQNNAKFQEKDWKGIQRPYDSIKGEDPMKIGRFGIGFNSVYHITDLPSVVSGDKVAFFDPHNKYLFGEDQKEKDSGALYSFSNIKNKLDCDDQFSPYNVLDCDMGKSKYEGTLFRFPLRVLAAARQSELSKKVCSPNDIKDVFKSFQADAHLVLLFLKSVESVKLLEWNAGECAPTEIFSVTLSQRVKERARTARQRIVNAAASSEKACSHFITEIVCNSGKETASIQRWMILHYTDNHPEIKKVKEAAKQIPWVGLAWPLQPLTEQAKNTGRIFCFLPLPPCEDEGSNSGLPVHVHGSFSVADNRRSLEWPSRDREKDLKARWNYLLLEYLLAPAFAQMIIEATKISDIPWEDVYSAWPVLKDVKSHWSRKVIPAFLKILSSNAVLWTTADVGRWVKVRDAVLCDLASSKSDVENITRERMAAFGKAVVQPPQNVRECLLEIFKLNFAVCEILSPRYVRTVLKQNAKYRRLESDEKKAILEYILKDKAFPELIGLELLPIASETFTCYQKHLPSKSKSMSANSTVFISTEECPLSLFPGMEHYFLSEDLSVPILKALKLPDSLSKLQLEFLKPEKVPDLVKLMLPQEWAGGTTRRKPWTPESGHYPGKEWIEALWMWLTGHPKVLERLQGSYIVPCNKFSKLAKLVKQDCVIFAEQYDHVKEDSSVLIEPSLAKGLEKMGCAVLQDVPEYLLRITDLTKYIWPPTRLLSCITAAVSLESYSQLSDCQATSLILLLSNIIGKVYRPNDREKSTLMRLPLFPKWQSGNKTSLNDCRLFTPRDFPTDLPLRISLLCYPSPEEEMVLKIAYEGARSQKKYRMLTCDEIFLEYVFPNFGDYTSSDKIAIAKYLLKSNTSNEVRNKMSDLPFVPVADGSLKKPSALFASSNKYALELFHGQPVFPTGEFSADSKYGRILVSEIKMRSEKSISAEELLCAAKTARDGSQQKANALLKLFVENGWARDEMNKSIRPVRAKKPKTFDGELRKIAWCPVKVCPPDDYPSSMPWKGKSYSESGTCLPRNVVCASSAISSGKLPFLIGSEHFVLDWDSPVTENVCTFLGCSWPSAAGVVSQWSKASENFKSHMEERETKRYDLMMKKVFNSIPAFKTDGLKNAIAKSQLSKCVWISGSEGFVGTDKLAQSADFRSTLEPWLFKTLSYSHLKGKQVVDVLDIRENFSPTAIIQVLSDIRNFHSTTSEPRPQTRVTNDLELAVEILNWVADKIETIPSEAKEKLLIPVEGGTKTLDMLPSSKVTYCDAEWLRSTAYNKREGIDVIHRKVTSETAFRLGVQSLRRRIAKPEQFDVGFEIEELEYQEPLTTRLKNILGDYKDDVGIFKELIQNADDAEATEVNFLIDWRESPTKSLLSNELKDCQGPALWAYNNAEFRESDFKNIAKLAAKTKLNDLNKIGRFGLGFTSTYHITELPSFVSGRFVVFFDPHCRYLSDFIKDSSKPGLRIDFVSARLADVFYDQFLPYFEIFGCDIKKSEPFRGTLFRFPLRTEDQAKVSKIKNVPYTKEKVKVACEGLLRIASKLPLFLNHVKSIGVYSLLKDCPPSKIEQVFRISSVNTPSPVTCFFSNQYELLQRLRSVIEAGGERRHLPQEQLTLSVVKSVTVKNSGQSAETSRWLICCAAGREGSLQFAKSEEGRKNGLMPFSGAAILLDPESNPIPVQGEVYCFLPLSILTKLPFHVNGFFSVHSNRRELWDYTTEDIGFRADNEIATENLEANWNKLLINDSLTEASLVLIQSLAMLLCSTTTLEKYYKSWPSIEKMHSKWEGFGRSFYEAVVNDKHKLFFSRKSQPQWQSFSRSVILSSDVLSLPHAEKFTASALSNYVQIPNGCSHIISSLEIVDKNILERNTLTLEGFSKKVLELALPTMDVQSRNELIKAILMKSIPMDLESSSCLKVLKNTNFIPCSPDGQTFRKPCDLLERKGWVLSLFNPDDERFTFYESWESDPSLSFALKRLGLKASDDLNWSDVFDRMQSVKRLKNGRDRRVVSILKLMKQLLYKETERHNDILRRVKEIKFLPVATCPRDYPLGSDWHGKAETLTAPFSGKVFPWDQWRLVGSQADVLTVSYSDIPQKVCQFLEFVEPSMDMLLNQLDAAIKHFRQAAQPGKNLVELFVVLYKELARRIPSKEQEIPPFLKEKAWILVGGNLMSSNRMAFEWRRGSGALPYLCQVPSELTHCRELLKCAGVRDSFTFSDFSAVLLDMAKAFKIKHMGKKEMDIATTLLREFIDLPEKDFENLPNGIPLISEKCNLISGEELTYKDVDWVSNDSDKGYLLVHKSIPMELAKSFGAKSLREKAFGDFSTFLGNPYGQHEKLTRRLNNIIRAYPWGQQILKELVQNADDAGASVVHIIYDKRQHDTERVFGENWKSLQGPSLLVYNDRTFTEKDFEGMQQLGYGSKREDAAATGQFGIGFNAVYHLTDCPSFLSGNETLCVLDPRCKYVPGASLGRPGCRCEPSSELWQRFPDVRKGYAVLDEPYLSRGTLFRFPLRTDQSSEISDRVVSKEDINDLLAEFIKGVADVLIFLSFVKTISISVIAENDSRLVKIFSGIAKQSDSDPEKLNSWAKHVANCAESAKKGEEVGYFGITYELVITSTFFSCAHPDYKKEASKTTKGWLIHQSVGVDEAASSFGPTKIDDVLFLPRAGVAVPLTKEGALKSGKAFCSLPLPGDIPLPVNINGSFALSSDRHSIFKRDPCYKEPKQEWNERLIQFCVVPAYVQILLKSRSYIESHSLLLNPKDRLDKVVQQLDWFFSLFPPCTKSCTTSYWNSLCQNFYCYLGIEKVKVFPKIDRPLLQDRKDAFSSVKDKTEKATKIVDDLMKQLPENFSIEWLSMRKDSKDKPFAYFWDRQEVFQQFGGEMASVSAFRLKCVFLQIGLPLLATPRFIFEYLNNAEIEIEKPSPEVVCEFLAQHYYSVGRLSKTVLNDTRNAVILLKYTFFSEAKELSALIEGLPLLITEGNQLQSFSCSSPVYFSSFSRLLPDKLHLFVHYSLRNFFSKNQKTKEMFYEARVLKDFTITELKEHLDQSTIFVGGNHVADSFVDWDPKVLSNKSWISSFWDFVTSQEPGKLQNYLDPLKKCPLIPVLIGHGNYLVPPSLTFAILDLDPSEPSSFCKVLINVETARLNTDCISKEAAKTLRQIIGTWSQTDSTIVALEYHFQEHFRENSLEKSDAEVILKHYNGHAEDIGENVVCKLRKFPIFETLSGHFKKLLSNDAFTLPGDILLHGCDVWINRSEAAGVIFLKYKPECDSLYNKLKLNGKSLSDVYVNYILPCFDELADEDRLEHLFVVANFYKDSAWKRVVDLIEETPCFRFHGDLLKVKSFFDPRVELFQLMQPCDCFPPSKDEDEVEEERWLSFLIELGLQRVATPEKFVEFAQLLESDPVWDPENWKSKSKALVSHLFLNGKCYLESCLDFSLIAQTKFLATAEVDTQLCSLSLPDYKRNSQDQNDSLHRTSYRDGLLFTKSNELLCWRSELFFECNLVDSHHRPEYSQLKERLAIKESPSLDNVLCNYSLFLLDMWELTIPPDEGDLITRAIDVVKGAFTYLQNIVSSEIRFNPVKHDHYTDLREVSATDNKLSCKIIEELRRQPCVLISTEDTIILAKPTQVVRFASALQNIPPYLYQIPDEYVQYMPLLNILGVDVEARPFHFARVLETISADSQGLQLDDESWSRAISATQQLFLSLLKIQGISTEATIAPLKPLYLPTRERRLRRSSQLVYLDKIEFEIYLEHLKEIDFLIDLVALCKLSQLPEKTTDLLPDVLRPQTFSSLAQEHVLRQNWKSSTSEENIEITSKLETIMRSAIFINGVRSMYLHKNSAECVPDRIKSRLLALSRNIRVKCLKTFKTCLRIIKDEETVSATERFTSVFLEVDEENSETFLFLADEAFIDRMMLYGRVVQEIQAYLRTDLSELVLLTILKAENAAAVVSILKRHGIPFVSDSMELSSASDSHSLDFQQDSSIDFSAMRENDVRLGLEISSAHMELLQKCDGFFLSVEELVVYQNEYDVYIYAVIEYRLRTPGQERADAEDSYMIDVGGNELIQVCSGRLFRIRLPQSVSSDESQSNKETEKSLPALLSWMGSSQSCGVFNVYPKPSVGKMFIEQARADLEVADALYEKAVSGKSNFFAAVCFHCHEAVEKTLKGILLIKEGLSFDRQRKHKIWSFVDAADLPGCSKELSEHALTLSDSDYLCSRYPDAISDVPAFYYKEEEASKALAGARGVIECLRHCDLD